MKKLASKDSCGSTHHNACACREAYFAKLEAELKTTKEFYEDCKQSRLSACERAEALEAELKKRGTKTNTDFVNSVEFHKETADLAIEHATQLEAKLKLAEEALTEISRLKYGIAANEIARTALAELRKV